MSAFSGKQVLITGGAGFIGSNLAHYFEKQGAEVVVFDRFQDTERLDNGNKASFGHYKNLLGFKGEVVAGDINDREALLELGEFDYIFHQAAISDTTVGDQKRVIETNVNTFKTLLQMAQKSGAPLVYASSGAVYGKLPAPHRVGTEAPANVYGYSKLAMDHIAMRWAKKSDFPIVGLRYFNVYGPREYFKEKTASMVLQFGLQLLKGEPAKLFEGSDKIKRDFIYVDDVVQANVLAATKGASGIFNVGTGKARSFQDIVDILKAQLGIEREDAYIPNPYVKQYQFFTEADIEPTRKVLGYEPRYSLEEGIRADIPYIRKIFEEELQ